MRFYKAPTAPALECSECGVEVSNPSQHEDWHLGQERLYLGLAFMLMVGSDQCS